MVLAERELKKTWVFHGHHDNLVRQLVRLAVVGQVWRYMARLDCKRADLAVNGQTLLNCQTWLETVTLGCEQLDLVVKSQTWL